MFGSEIADVALGLVFIYLLLSLVITALQEVLAAWFKLRAKNLWNGIRNLLPAAGQTDIAKAIYEHPLVKGLARGHGQPTYIPSRTFMLALLETIAPSTPTKVNGLADVTAALDNLPDGDVKKALTGLLQDSSQDLEKFKLNIEIWYGQAMDRVIGWYKRDTQNILLVVGFVIAALLNADTVQIAQKLYASPERRASILEKIKAFDKSPAADALRQAEKPAEPNASIPPASPSPSASPSPTLGGAETGEQENLTKELNAAATGLARTVRNVELTGLVGWTHSDCPKDFGDLFVKFIGLLLTAFAISLGAPFWFDLLNKFMNIRAAGKAPEEAPKKPKEEPPAQRPGGADAA